MLGNKGGRKHYRVGGTRGGQDQFKWDDVKTDKYRENYLGNSVHAAVGRWQKGRDLTWYAKNKEERDSALEEEKRRLRDLDDDLLNAALGIRSAPKKWTETAALDASELKQLLARGSERPDDDALRSQGLGAGAAKFHDHIDRTSRIELEIQRMKAEQPPSEADAALPSRIIIPQAADPSREHNPPAEDRSSDESSAAEGHKRKRHKADREERKRNKKERKEKKHKKDKDRRG